MPTMPTIHFVCLVDDEHAAPLAGRFEQVAQLLVRDGKMSSFTVTHDENPQVAPEVDAQLRLTYTTDRDHDVDEVAEITGGMRPHGYRIGVEGVQGSVNQIAMILSRVLTPAADLPADGVQLHREEDFEQPATFPWTVQIYR